MREISLHDGVDVEVQQLRPDVDPVDVRAIPGGLVVGVDVLLQDLRRIPACVHDVLEALVRLQPGLQRVVLCLKAARNDLRGDLEQRSLSSLAGGNALERRPALRPSVAQGGKPLHEVVEEGLLLRRAPVLEQDVDEEVRVVALVAYGAHRREQQVVVPVLPAVGAPCVAVDDVDRRLRLVQDDGLGLFDGLLLLRRLLRLRRRLLAVR